MELVTKVLEILKDHGHDNLAPRQFNAVIDACNLIVKELGVPVAMASKGMGLANWLRSDDTGLSSRFMAHVLCDAPLQHKDDHGAFPWDPADFGRCVRFLEAVPTARDCLNKMRAHGATWSSYIDNWEEMEHLYQEESPSGKAPKLFAMMKRLQDESREPRP